MMKHWLISSHHLDPADRPSGTPWMVATKDTRAPGARQDPFRKTVWEIEGGDWVWVWNPKRESLANVFRAKLRHSRSDGDGELLHPFYPELRVPAVTWDVEGIAVLEPGIDRPQLFDLYNEHDRGACGYKLFVGDKPHFQRSLYCFGPLAPAFSDALLKTTGLGSGSLVLQDEEVALAREETYRQIRVRQGQPEFRQTLIDAYGGRCAVSGCSVVEVLEAAHIVPYGEQGINSVRNGLLLRSDLHTLFDLGLLCIDVESRRVGIATQLRTSKYGNLHGRQLREPADPTQRPSSKYLSYRHIMLSAKAISD